MFDEIVLLKMPLPVEKLIAEYIAETYQQACATFDVCMASDAEPNWGHFIREITSDGDECAGSECANPPHPPHSESKAYDLISELLVTESHFTESLSSLQAIMADLQSEGSIKKMEQDVESMLEVHGRFVAELGDKINSPQRSLEDMDNLIYKHVRQAYCLQISTVSLSGSHRDFLASYSKASRLLQTAYPEESILLELMHQPIQRLFQYTIQLKELAKLGAGFDNAKFGESLKLLNEFILQHESVHRSEEDAARLFEAFNEIENCPVSLHPRQSVGFLDFL